MSIIGDPVCATASGGGGGLPGNMKLWTFDVGNSDITSGDVKLIENDAWLASHWDDDGLLIEIIMPDVYTAGNIAFVNGILRNVSFYGGNTRGVKQCKFYKSTSTVITGTSKSYALKDGNTSYSVYRTDSTGTLTVRANTSDSSFRANTSYVILGVLCS